jgi:TolA-binding protein
MNLLNENPEAKAATKDASLVDWFVDDFWPRFGKQVSYALPVIIVIVAGAVWFNNDRVKQASQENKQLGPAYVYYSEDKNDSALAFLTKFLATSHSRLVQDKANLLLGQIQYGNGKYDEAIKAFSQVDLANTDQPLISSGAMHGLASCYIQNKNYPLAVETLEKFVSRFGRRTGKPSEKVAGGEVADLSPSVPNALWKLALSYREMKDVEKSKATAKKLVAIYPESREAFDATRLLAQLN